MPKVSAALMMFRRAASGQLQVLLAHPGGPYFRNKDLGAWTIPKGELEFGEEALAAAQREFQEELGLTPHGPFLALSTVKQQGGKVVHAWAFEGDCDPTQIVSIPFVLEWPPGSGEQVEFPEVDRAEFFGVAEAEKKINAAQAVWLTELTNKLDSEAQSKNGR